MTHAQARATNARLLPGLSATALPLITACATPPPPGVPCADLPADDKGHAAHCLVTGQINERVGVDRKRYAIGFELRLPTGWSGRFLHQLDGCNDGVVKPAFGEVAATLPDALSRGFAVISSDSGHHADDPANAAAGLARGNLFGPDPQPRRDHGYSASGAVWPVAQALMAHHYGRPAQRNYMAGCANGGRHGMVAASRYAGRYDGILAGAPGFNLPRAAVQHAWDIQRWKLADADIRRAFSPADMRLVADRVVTTRHCRPHPRWGR